MAIFPDPSITIALPHLLQQAAQQAKRQARSILVSLTERIWSLDTIDLFEQAASATADRFFWSQPDEDFTLVGLGIAQALEAVEESRFRQIGTAWRNLLRGAILEGLRGLPDAGPLLFGGFAFDPQQPKTSLWRDYPDGRMVLPKVLYTQKHNEAWLTCNVIVDPDSNLEAEQAAMSAFCEQLFVPSTTYHPENRSKLQVTMHDLRPAADWQAEVVQAAQDIADGKLEKTVLARAVRLETSESDSGSAPFNAANALRRLSANYKECFIFAIARGERCFLGATPERLAEVHDGEIRTMALAGSVQRGTTENEDRAFGESLLASAKDRNEHAVVVKFIAEALQGLSHHLTIAVQPTLLKLGNVQHLYTPVRGRLADGHTLLDVVERLHPTPAVGGRPREAALSLIREREGLDRGWYAGPVGWIDRHGEGKFVVAIRSALLHRTSATLFAGCGIVADSNPEREYAESCLKLKPMLSALTGE
ncbi:MAG: isochorismate synthase [Chloroflexota bacterium]